MSIDYSIERNISEYLAAHYGIEPDQLSDDATLEDLGVDSLGLLVIADIIENAYGISLDDERIAGVRTLGDLNDLVALKRAALSYRSTHLTSNSSFEATSS